MSVRVMTKVFAESESKLAARLVLLALADAASDDGVAWLGQDLLAEKAKVATATVRECLRTLEGLGEVQTRKAQRGRSRINVYLVSLPGLADVDYDRLPFKLVAPFDDRGNLAVVEADDRGITGSTTAGSPASSRTRDPLGGTVMDPEGAKAPSARLPGTVPAVTLIGGRHLGWDVLALRCGINPADPNRSGELAVALNGGKSVKVGIRSLAWQEIVEQHFGGADAEAWAVTEAEPERFENALALMIERRCDQYVGAMSGAMLTPTALAKWWLSLENLAANRQAGGMTPEEIERLGASRG